MSKLVKDMTPDELEKVRERDRDRGAGKRRKQRNHLMARQSAIATILLEQDFPELMKEARTGKKPAQST